MTLLINGPLLAPLMTWLKLNTISTVKKQVGWAGWLGWCGVVEGHTPQPVRGGGGGGAYRSVHQGWRSLPLGGAILGKGPSGEEGPEDKTGPPLCPPSPPQIRSKTKQALLQYTDSVIDELRGQGAEMMRGVDWAAVEAYVDLKRTLDKVRDW